MLYKDSNMEIPILRYSGLSLKYEIRFRITQRFKKYQVIEQIFDMDSRLIEKAREIKKETSIKQTWYEQMDGQTIALQELLYKANAKMYNAKIPFHKVQPMVCWSSPAFHISD